MGKRIVVNDSFQRGYVYALTAPAGKAFDPEFRPELSPREMLALGVFDGDYFGGEHDEFPAAWFTNARLAVHGPDPGLNCFGVHASQPLEVWEAKGWIRAQDPRGWFQWYCRYWRGRRSEDDARQIRRWKAMTRHVAQVKKNCKKGDLSCRRKQRQALLHWAIDSRKL